jgi:hypothetical protein
MRVPVTLLLLGLLTATAAAESAALLEVTGYPGGIADSRSTTYSGTGTARVSWWSTARKLL